MAATEPPLTFTVEPLEPPEGGNLVYALVGAQSGAAGGTAKLWFGLKVSNGSDSSLHLNKIQVALITGGIPIVHNFNRDLDIPASSTRSGGDFELHEDETIALPLPAPLSAVIGLFCDGFANPKTVQLALSAYVPATPNNQYIYPADEGNIGPEQYFSGGTHLPPHSQRWGTDWQVYRVIDQGTTSVIRTGGVDSVNEDHLGWGVPIRAMADGIVLRTSTGWIANPEGKRAFQLMAEYDGEDISDVKVTRLGPQTYGVQRAASLVRLPAGAMQLTVWDLAQFSREIVRLGSSDIDPAEQITDMALDALDGTRVVASVRLTNGTHRLKVWGVSPDGLTITNQAQHDEIAVSEVSLMKLSANRVASGVRTASGDLRVAVFSVGTTNITLLAEDSAGAATSIATATPSSTRVAIALRTAQGTLKTIVWDLTGSGPYSLERKGDYTAESISGVVGANNDGGKWYTAFRTSPGGILKLTRWAASSDGMTLTNELVTPAHAIQSAPIAIAPATGSSGTIHAVTGTILPNGTFQINGWGDPGDNNAPAETSSSNTWATATQVSLDQTDDLFFIAGTRTVAGNLEIATWHWASGGGNSVYVLHGNCRVLYAHFQEGSVNTNVLYPGASVVAGQVLGHMGNSGASGTVHTHIHADRVYPITDIANMIALEATNGLPIIGARPIPFSSARTMRLSQISPGGEGNAANSFTTMNNQVMFDVALGIRPRLNTRYLDRASAAQVPTGRKEVLPGIPTTGGPYNSTVALALAAAPSGARLYIRGGSYNQAVIFTKPMHIRRYDYYDTAGSVIINP
jgi:hypothetical protein